MKHKAQRDTDGVVEPHLVPVKFEFIDPTATTVCIAGTFNQWQPEAKALHPAGGGRWFKKTSLAPGTYEYRLVVDGQWMADPLAAESVPNPFGGRNSVLKVVDASEPVAFSNVADAAAEHHRRQEAAGAFGHRDASHSV